VIDELLPEVTTEALAALMQRDEEQRPVEGISWELKSEVSKNRIPRTVCAFANTLGSILILGARDARGRSAHALRPPPRAPRSPHRSSPRRRTSRIG
jgi:hypothetical protein